MNIISIFPETTTRTVGRLSNGSDRQVITETIYTVLVHDGGRKYLKTFTHEPTEQIIKVVFDTGQFSDITSVTDTLENDTAFLALELVDTQIRLDQAENEQAWMLLELVNKGVL
ncbi:MAG: hypothetical protein P0Y55_12010 [Candidatus Cohnella colombiensis]|uniref:Uncharacterized protein n=1 Tax=Candidatus Cohnella colombiensis TaxID=3121368 RepID=A0AA95EUJ6_9BACL|nr:MAG: hypothetical protein P0Y55_12010 [Cohnella sp.]